MAKHKYRNKNRLIAEQSIVTLLTKSPYVSDKVVMTGTCCSRSVITNLTREALKQSKAVPGNITSMKI